MRDSSLHSIERWSQRSPKEHASTYPKYKAAAIHSNTRHARSVDLSGNIENYALSLSRTSGIALELKDTDRSCRRRGHSTHLMCSHVKSKAAPSKITAEMRAIIIAARCIPLSAWYEGPVRYAAYY